MRLSISSFNYVVLALTLSQVLNCESYGTRFGLPRTQPRGISTFVDPNCNSNCWFFAWGKGCQTCCRDKQSQNAKGRCGGARRNKCYCTVGVL